MPISRSSMLLIWLKRDSPVSTKSAVPCCDGENGPLAPSWSLCTLLRSNLATAGGFVWPTRISCLSLDSLSMVLCNSSLRRVESVTESLAAVANGMIVYSSCSCDTAPPGFAGDDSDLPRAAARQPTCKPVKRGMQGQNTAGRTQSVSALPGCGGVWRQTGAVHAKKISRHSQEHRKTLSRTFQYALNAQQVLLEAHHGIGRAAGHFGVICKRCCRSHTSGRPRSDASMHRRAAHGTAGACSIASMHAMKTCVRRRLRGIAHARWVQGNVGSANDPHRLALSASKRGTQSHRHTRDATTTDLASWSAASMILSIWTRTPAVGAPTLCLPCIGLAQPR